MRRGRRAALAIAVCLAGAIAPAAACTLVLAEHRSGRELLQWQLAPGAPAFEIAFEHSVLGTTVRDRYEPRAAGGTGTGWRAHLVEERYAGEGYGLPSSAGRGERLQRDGDGWRLQLDREVHPLVVRPLPAQRMRLRVGADERLLGTLSKQAIELSLRDCALPAP
jgi:hypothetical protein